MPSLVSRIWEECRLRNPDFIVSVSVNLIESSAGEGEEVYDEAYLGANGGECSDAVFLRPPESGS